jgi:hypothetical protein
MLADAPGLNDTGSSCSVYGKVIGPSAPTSASAQTWTFMWPILAIESSRSVSAIFRPSPHAVFDKERSGPRGFN